MKYLTIICSLLTVVLSSCEYDNFAEPKSILSGKVVYNGQTLGVRSDGPQFELWEEGHALRTFIPVYIKYDGTYSASLFDGQYKLVRKGDSPWLQQSADTIQVTVKGNTIIDVPVTPYFTITESNFKNESGKVTARFKVNKVVESANLDVVRLFFGKSILLDNAKLASQNHRVDANKSNIVFGQESSIVAQVPDDLKNLDYVYVRLGVKSTVTGEYIYSPEQRLDLK